MKCLIVSLASQYVHSTLAPWYLFYSAKSGCNENIGVKVFEGTVNESVEDIYKRILEEKADLIAFSCYIWNIEKVYELALKLHKDGKKILLGGPEVSYNSVDILKNRPYVDYVLCGEGEEPFCQFLNKVYENVDLSAVAGLCFRKGKEIYSSAPHTTDLVPVSPYGAEYLAALRGRIAYLETSRGCPFSCAFCLSGRLGGVRFFPLERAKSDILTLANSGSKIIKLVDRTFNANPKRANEIWKFIIENHGKAIPRDVCFHFEIAGDLLREEDFELLKTAPASAIQFEIGIQSFNEQTLKAVNRKTDTKILANNIKRLCQMGNIHIHIDLIAGLPFEDFASFRNSFNTAFSLNADMLQLGFLKLIHGADMREKRDEYPLEFSSVPPYEVKATPWIHEKELEILHYTENALDRFVGSGRFLKTNELVFEKMGYNPFDTLAKLGEFTGLDSCPLNDYVEKIYTFFGKDEKSLRDALITDIATSVKNGRLPKCLNVSDERLKKLKVALETNPKTRRKSGVMRNVFILYGENCGAYVDYDESVKGRFLLHRVELIFD